MRSHASRRFRRGTLSTAIEYRHSAPSPLAKIAIFADIFASLQRHAWLQSARLSPTHLPQACFPRAFNLNLLKGNWICYLLDGRRWFQPISIQLHHFALLSSSQFSSLKVVLSCYYQPAKQLNNTCWKDGACAFSVLNYLGIFCHHWRCGQSKPAQTKKQRAFYSSLFSVLGFLNETTLPL